MRWRDGIESGSKVWLGCGLAAIVALAGAGPVTAGTLYVTDYGTTTIHRVETDGTGLATLMSGSPNLRGAAVDAVHGKLYWLEAGPNKLRRANLDGSLVEDVVTGMPGSPYELALDATGGKVYWTEYVGALAIRRANLDGTAVEDLVTSGHSQPLGIALDLPAGKMYWADYDLGTDQPRRSRRFLCGARSLRPAPRRATWSSMRRRGSSTSPGVWVPEA